MDKNKRKQLIVALITAPTKQDACNMVGIDPRTLYNYMQDPKFIEEYNACVDILVADTIADLKLTVKNGISALNELILYAKDDNTRLKAIKISLDSMKYLYRTKENSSSMDAFFDELGDAFGI